MTRVRTVFALVKRALTKNTQDQESVNNEASKLPEANLRCDTVVTKRQLYGYLIQ